MNQPIAQLTTNEIQSIIENEKVKHYKSIAETATSESVSVPFYVEREAINDSILEKIGTLGVSIKNNVPLRWIRGDTHGHVDNSSTDFNNTYIVYLTDSVGSLFFRDTSTSFPIKAGHSYKFNEGVYHETVATEGLRLCLGPMNEQGMVVGCSAMFYYSDSSQTLLYGYTDFCGFTAYVSDVSVIPGEYRPQNSVFVGWRLFYVDNNGGNTPEFTIGQIIPPGTQINVYLNYYVSPVWESLSKLHFTDNSLVFYKPGSLAAGGVSTVRNSRHKSKRT